ncbi:hypothetical protein JR316_0004436 [Psilocybe cubensis]|uniref:Uncharacterized protein n=1 Tax=Psilocybe cubensis TaxID=181762 RepID=A0ACB8H3H2_PSICU|nr:hypothetical protein JR316_0004436 [Psilocybe cubensis]KAH9482338.1 hypothetical protein JR316_0004436 [Psilocybe cubensis]
MAGNGFSFWPGSNAILPEPYTQRTIEIGDVGYIDPEGNFNFVFNLFLPADDPLNQLWQDELPQGYIPLDPPCESEISRIPGYYPPGSVIVTKGVDVDRLGETPLHLKFTSSEPEAAVLVLPDGARREDLATSRVQAYLKKHAENWIRFFSGANSPHAIPNGGIYVITGFDKTASYSASIFPGRGFLGTRHISVEYANGFRQLDSKTGIVSYNWKPSKCSIDERCFFLRGIRMGLSDPEWNLQIDEVHPDRTPVSALPPTPPISDQVLPPKQDGIRSILPDSDSHTDELDIDGDDEGNQDPVVDPIVKVRNGSLYQYPDAKVALVDDYIWSNAIEHSQKPNDPLTFKCSQGAFISDWGALLDNIFKYHRIVETDGVLLPMIFSSGSMLIKLRDSVSDSTTEKKQFLGAWHALGSGGFAIYEND